MGQVWHIRNVPSLEKLYSRIYRAVNILNAYCFRVGRVRAGYVNFQMPSHEYPKNCRSFLQVSFPL